MRASGHFLFKLEIGDLSFQILRDLHVGFGHYLCETSKAVRDNGQGDLLAFYFHRTPAEQQGAQGASATASQNKTPRASSPCAAHGLSC